MERRDFIRIFSQAQFLTSAGNAAGLPAPDLPELVFAGRSNVGKSSAINALTGRKRLAFTSKTPGRTQTINFYALGAEDDVRARLVDLPGSLAGAGKRFATEERIDRARLADVRAPGEGDFGRPGGRQIRGPACRSEELCVREYSNKIAPFDHLGARG